MSEYQIWMHMTARCHNPRNKTFPHYGGRGIIVCERWRTSFANFLEDMGRRPDTKYTLDRIETNGNYEKGNCRWATWTTQQNNRRNNRMLTYLEKTKTLAQWADELGLPHNTLSNRLKLGWSVEKALTSQGLRGIGLNARKMSPKP